MVTGSTCTALVACASGQICISGRCTVRKFSFGHWACLIMNKFLIMFISVWWTHFRWSTWRHTLTLPTHTHPKLYHLLPAYPFHRLLPRTHFQPLPPSYPLPIPTLHAIISQSCLHNDHNGWLFVTVNIEVSSKFKCNKEFSYNFSLQPQTAVHQIHVQITPNNVTIINVYQVRYTAFFVEFRLSIFQSMKVKSAMAST